MIDRFEGEVGRSRLIEALATQKLVRGDLALATAIADAATLCAIEAGAAIIEEGGHDGDVYFIVTGAFDILVHGRTIARRNTGDHVGEMAVIEPTSSRSATVVSNQPSIVARMRRETFIDLATRFPNVWRGVAKELARRLNQRYQLMIQTRERPRIFVMSSTETLPIARAIQASLEYDPCTVEVWTDGVFRASTYALENLEAALDECDFAIAISAGDDVVTSSAVGWPASRDNVTFELGYFIGRLGRQRTILLEPRHEGVKLPSDVAGLTTIGYTWEPGRDQATRLEPTRTKLRALFKDLGPR